MGELFLRAAGDPAVSTTDIMGVISPVTTQFSVSNITSLLVALLGVTVVFGFLWWGVRFVTRKVMSAATGGNVSVSGGRRRR